MSESNAIIPYDQPSEDRLQAFEHYLMCDDNDSRPINITELPTSSQQMLDQSTVANTSDVLDDQFIMDGDMFDEELQTIPSRVQDETNIGDRSRDFGNPIQLSTWPMQVSPYTCSCCQTLREISHTNGVF